MTIHALVSGALFKLPEQRLSKIGKPFVTGTLRVPEGNNLQFVRFIAFSETAQAELLRLDDGDAISAQGTFKAETYEKDGEHRISLSLIADQVLALRQPPRERRAEPAPQDTRSRQERCAGSWKPGGGPNDAIPFGEPR